MEANLTVTSELATPFWKSLPVIVIPPPVLIWIKSSSAPPLPVSLSGVTSVTVGDVLSIITGPAASTEFPDRSNIFTAPFTSPVPAVNVIAFAPTVAVIPVGQVLLIRIWRSSELEEVPDPPVYNSPAVFPVYFI